MWQLHHNEECSSDSDLDVSIEMEDEDPQKETPPSTQSGANSDSEDDQRQIISSQVLMTNHHNRIHLNHSQYYLSRILTK